MNLLAKKAELRYDADIHTAEDIAQLISELGFSAAPIVEQVAGESTIQLHVEMKCGSSVGNIERTLATHEGVLHCCANFALSEVSVTFDNRTGARDVFAVLADLGFNPKLAEADDRADDLRRRMEIQKYHRKVISCMVFEIPALFLAFGFRYIPPFSGWLHRSIYGGLTVLSLIMWILATLLFSSLLSSCSVVTSRMWRRARPLRRSRS